ncbi:hypothetical protein CDD82_6063 [Ophiocordyceps australis]|uniref:Uncharacterized protein n=1 Tax=Ophiocordyceps australis TaxID=1399860 RepID=A0A2C5ZR93_9HYPO|nr:hypothetical protein CDD82_6063 [Ophiocordyceps australis]
MAFLTHGLALGPGGLSRPVHHGRPGSNSRRHRPSSLGAPKHRSRSPSSSRLRLDRLSCSPRGRRRRPYSPASLASSVARNPSHSWRSSLFNLGSLNGSSLFGFRGSSSYYKRSPRHGFLQRTYRKLRRLLRRLGRYARRHPWKVFFLVIMPLITGGVLSALLARFGLRLPPSIEHLLAMASRATATGHGLGFVSDAVLMAGDLVRSKYSSNVPSRGSEQPSLHWKPNSYYKLDPSYYPPPPPPRANDDAWPQSIMGVARLFI